MHRVICVALLSTSHLDFDRVTPVTRTPDRMATVQQLASLLSTDRLKAAKSWSFSINANEGLAVIVREEVVNLEVSRLLQKLYMILK